MEELIGKIVLCSDGYIRRLTRVGPKVVSYENYLNNHWSDYGETWTSQATPLFLQGRVCGTVEEALSECVYC